MIRALLVGTGTVAGVVAVFSYSAGEFPVVASDVPAADVVGLGQPAASPAPARPVAPSGSPAATSSASPKPQPGRTSTRVRTASPSAPPTPTRSKAPSPSPTKKSARPSTKPTPSPTPTPKPTGEFTGSSVSFTYGTLQMAIKVVDGAIVDAWAVAYPQGESTPYSEMAIPILRQQTIGATSARIAGATGASFTSNAWVTSLAAAMSRAGLR